jgi:CheY-like chemotaxis protein
MQTASSQLKITVRDTGIGIPECDLPKIFQMFSKLDDNCKLQMCGLGLSISSALVKKLGEGTITVQSDLGKGSAFTFEVDILERQEASIRLQTEDETMAREDETFSSILIPESTSSIHNFDYPHPYPEVLIVDDVPFNRSVIRKMLEIDGYLCEEAGTGLQALTIVRKRSMQGRPFRVVFMDVDMPEMDGITATRAISELQHEDPQMLLPVIIGCSAYTSEADITVGLEAGMRDYICKPIFRDELLRLMSRLISA